jgi:hypothetical protein
MHRSLTRRNTRSSVADGLDLRLAGMPAKGDVVSRIDWHIRGYDLTACNCDYGCPCQFMALPTRGHCRANVAMHVVQGHFGDTRLDGLTFGGLFSWPGPIHEGGGEVLPFVDERATPEQREALLKIMTGQETEPGATIFNVFATTYSTVHPPRFLPIRFECDVERRTGLVSIPGVVETRAEPIRNPITGAEMRARLVLPDGFEFVEAEIARGTVHTGPAAPIDLQWDGLHAHLVHLDMTGAGPARLRAA